MSILKYAIIGAAVAYGIKHITEVREDGTSILDGLTKDAPEWMDKAKHFANDTLNNFKAKMPEEPPYREYEQTV
ncbi:MAG: YtxH domain-containing protein [Sphingobacteriales bacterium]